MYATINVPGSSRFEWWGPASKAECEAWQKARVAQVLDDYNLQLSDLLPLSIHSNKDAESWRWQDGELIITPVWRRIQRD